MVITVNTDASFSHKYLRGTYAFWIVCDEFRLQKSGILRKKCIRPEQAEFKCIINALHTMLCSPRSRKITSIIVNTDCMNVIHLVNNDKKAIQAYGLNGWGTQLVFQMNQLLSKHGLRERPKFRHVKSHEHTNTPRNYVNQWCDDAAKAEMKKLLNNIKYDVCKCTGNDTWGIGGRCIRCRMLVKQKNTI